MIATVTLNPCIDRTLLIENFNRGGMNRVVSVRQDAAGKGVNVSMALRGLGLDSLCLGFNYTENGDFLTNKLDALDIRHDFIQAEGALRLNVKVFEQDTGIMTEFNQRGSFVAQSSVDALVEKIMASGADTLVLSGSLPQGIEATIYQLILACANAKHFILDAEGEALRMGLSGSQKPLLIKPNLFELESLLGVSLHTQAAIIAQARVLIQKGVGVVCVSMGKDGALMVNAEKAYYAPGLLLPVRGVQGAGDAMVAGILRALSENLPIKDWLRYAVAAASASVVLEGTQLCDSAGFAEMLKQVEVLEC